MTEHKDIIPGLSIHLMTPKPAGHLKAPWLAVYAGPLNINSADLTRGTAAALRALADEVDAVWAELDRRDGILPPAEAPGVANLLALDGAAMPAEA